LRTAKLKAAGTLDTENHTMSMAQVAVVVLAAGKGTRMKSARSKVLHPIAGRTLLGHVLGAATALEPDRMVVVVGPEMDDVAAAAAPHPTAVQPEQRGTADAVKAARDALEGFAIGTVFVLYGDTPFIAAGTLQALLSKRETGAGVVVLGFRPEDPGAYGRLIVDSANRLQRIVEFRDASEEERRIDLCNSGVMAIDAAVLYRLVDAVDNKNANGEYYLTDIVALAREDNIECAVVEANAGFLHG